MIKNAKVRRRMHPIPHMSSLLFFFFCIVNSAWVAKPHTGKVIVEKNGIVSVEAENFSSQLNIEKREWKIIRKGKEQGTTGDPYSNHGNSASGGAYLKILPDTRVTHDDELIPGTNFSNDPGVIGVLNYKIRFKTIGKYYVWVRAYSTGGEDNGIHVGIDGTWPESGRRMQWCDGKNHWTWESKQRTEKNHCGEAEKIFLEIKEPGLHTVSFSMREDGFEFDKWVMSLEYNQPK